MSSRSPLLVAGLIVLAGLAGCAAPSAEQDAAVARATMAPGTHASLPVVLENASAPGDELSVEATDEAGLNVTTPDTLHGEADQVVGWLTVSVPSDAEEGLHEVRLELSGNGTETVRAPITVEDAGEGIPQGKVAMVEFLGLTEDGSLAVSNNQTIAQSALPKAESFREPRQFQPTPIRISPRARLPAQIVQAVQASAVNHTVGVDVPELYGPETQQDNVTREETIDRNQSAPKEIELPRRQAQQQGLIDRSTQEGDLVQLPNSELPYRVQLLNRTTVQIGLNVTEGENITVYPAWPDATQITNTSGENVTFRTDPTTEPGERFTWRQQWPDATEVVELTNETIVIRHSPEEGLTYTEQSRQGERNVTVVDLREDDIVIERENPHPLAGQDIEFTLTIVEQRDPPRRGQRR